MKKKRIIIISTSVILLVVIIAMLIIYKAKEVNKNIKSLNNDKIKMYYQLEDRYIYSHELKEIKLTYKNNTRELKDWLKEDKDFLNKYLSEIRTDEHIGYDDGGTTIFETADFNIIVCNVMGINKNIHIGKNLKYEGEVCKMPIVENYQRKEEIFLFHLGKYLEQLLGESGEETKLKEISLNKIINVDLNTIEYSKVMQHSKMGTYTIIKTDNQEVITKLENYFKDKYNNYQKTTLDNGYKVYVVNKDNSFTLGLKYILGTIESVPSNYYNLCVKGEDGNKYIVNHNTYLNFEVGQKVKILYNSKELPKSQYNIELLETYPLQIKIYGIDVEKQ